MKTVTSMKAECAKNIGVVQRVAEGHEQEQPVGINQQQVKPVHRLHPVAGAQSLVYIAPDEQQRRQHQQGHELLEHHEASPVVLLRDGPVLLHP